LLDSGADPRLLDYKGWTALIWAISRDRAAICECFLAYNLATHAEISAAIAVSIRLNASCCLSVFIRRVPKLAATMARLAIHVGNASALRSLCQAGLVDYKSKEPGCSQTLLHLAKQADPSLFQALRDGREFRRIQHAQLTVNVIKDEKRLTGVATITAKCLTVRIKTPLRMLARLLKSTDDFRFDWTNDVRFSINNRGIQIVFPEATVAVLPSCSWAVLEVCRTAAYMRCGAMPFADRLEILMKNEFANPETLAKKLGELVQDVKTAREQFVVRQQEINRRCALATSLGRPPSPGDAEKWRRFQKQIDICHHLIDAAQDVMIGNRNDIRTKSRTTPATTIANASPPYEAEELPEYYEMACVACLTGKKSYLAMPCRHLCLCSDCYKIAVWERCPICNDPVSEVIRIFL
jgi:hypothetical protein